MTVLIEDANTDQPPFLQQQPAAGEAVCMRSAAPMRPRWIWC